MARGWTWTLAQKQRGAQMWRRWEQKAMFFFPKIKVYKSVIKTESVWGQQSVTFALTFKYKHTVYFFMKKKKNKKHLKNEVEKQRLLLTESSLFTVCALEFVTTLTHALTPAWQGKLEGYSDVIISQCLIPVTYGLLFYRWVLCKHFLSILLIWSFSWDFLKRMKTILFNGDRGSGYCERI